MTPEEAYCAMFAFLEAAWERTGRGDEFARAGRPGARRGRAPDGPGRLDGLAGRNRADPRVKSYALADVCGHAFHGAVLEGVSFAGAEADRAYFNGAKLTRADFSSAYLKKTEFDHAVLRGAVLRDIHAVKTSFHTADLRGAEPSGSGPGRRHI